MVMVINEPPQPDDRNVLTRELCVGLFSCTVGILEFSARVAARDDDRLWSKLSSHLLEAAHYLALSQNIAAEIEEVAA